MISSTANEDKDKRLRAFLSCMRCEDVQSLLVPANVPQHAIILACVLRYILTATKIPVLQKPELDAFLALCRRLLQVGVRRIVHGDRSSACLNERELAACHAMADTLGVVWEELTPTGLRRVTKA